MPPKPLSALVNGQIRGRLALFGRLGRFATTIEGHDTPKIAVESSPLRTDGALPVLRGEYETRTSCDARDQVKSLKLALL